MLLTGKRIRFSAHHRRNAVLNIPISQPPFTRVLKNSDKCSLTERVILKNTFWIVTQQNVYNETGKYYVEIIIIIMKPVHSVRTNTGFFQSYDGVFDWSIQFTQLFKYALTTSLIYSSSPRLSGLHAGFVRVLSWKCAFPNRRRVYRFRFTSPPVHFGENVFDKWFI